MDPRLVEWLADEMVWKKADNLEYETVDTKVAQ